MTNTDFFATVGSAAEQAVDTAAGTGALALDVLRRPQRTRRRGAQVTDRVVREAEDLVDEALNLPERALLAYLRGVRRRARRDDVLGLVSRGLLGAVNGPAGTAADFFGRVESVTEFETRRRRSAAPAPARRAARTVKSAARRTKSSATTTRRRNAAGRSTRAVSRRGGRSTGTRRRTA